MPSGRNSPSRPDLRTVTILNQSPEIIMTAYRSHIEEIRAVRTSRERAAELLGRYPAISDQDRREVLDFLKNGRHLDIGLLTTSDRLRPRLDAFMTDHKQHFRVRWEESVALIAGIAALLAIFWLVWEAFA